MNNTNSLNIRKERATKEVTGYADRGHAADPDVGLYDDLLNGDGEKAVRELGLRLKRLVCKKCPDFSMDVDEIVLDILERTYERIESFRYDSRFFSWVCAIANHALQERIRHQQKQFVFEELSDDLISDCLNPEHYLMEQVTREVNLLLVEEALATLTERQCEVFKYKHTTNLTSAAIGERLGISAGAVRSASADAHASIARWRKKKGY